jgi:outer membrane murein-binding lipoprotein Lpp
MTLPVEEQSTATAPDDLRNGLDELSDDVAKLNVKVDAMMMAMMRMRRWADCAAHLHPALPQKNRLTASSRYS